MSTHTEPFAVMIKPVGSRCNMRCAYCYYLEKGQFSSHARQSRMQLALLERVISQMIDAGTGIVPSFTWHGGEPVLAGMDFYREAVAIQKRNLPKGVSAWNNLQTNGLALNDSWVRFLSENHFDVGISIDGSQTIHDANRKTPGGSGTWQTIVQNIGKLTRAGIQPDLLCTVNALTASHPEEVYEALSSLNTGWIQFIPVVIRDPDGSLAPLSVTAQAYGDFLCRVFDLWTHRDLGRLDVQLFAEMAKVLAGGEAGLCWMRETCGNVVVVEEDGAVYSCDHFVDDAHRLGFLQRSRLDRLAGSAEQLAFGSRKRDTLTGECRQCPYLRFCHGGCPKDRFACSENGKPGQYVLCAGLKQLFAHAVPILTDIMKKSKAGLTPAQIMASLY